MGDLSPVLQAFLAGQQGMTEMMTKASAVKQRQQQLDDIMKRFGVESKQKEKELELQNQIFELHHNIAQQDAGKQMIEQLRQSPETAPGTTTLQAPGINMANMGLAAAMKVPGQGNLAIARGAPGPDIPGMPRQVVTPPAPGTPITMPSAFGDISMLMPKSIKQQAVETQQALAPGQISEKRQEALDAADAYVKKMMPTLQNKLEISEARNDLLKQGYEESLRRVQYAADSRANTAELLAYARLAEERAKWGIPEDPDKAREMIGRYVHGMMIGNVTGNPVQSLGPVLGHQVNQAFNAAGGKPVAPKLMDDLNDIAGSGTMAIGNTDQFLQSNPPPKTTGEAIGNMFAQLPGINKLSSTGKSYNNYKSTTISTIEKALGLPLGRINGSPAILKQFEPMLVQPTDDPQTVANKKNKLADIVVNGIAKKVNSYPIVQRQHLLQEVISANPGLMQDKATGSKLLKFLDEGTFTPSFQIPKIQ